MLQSNPTEADGRVKDIVEKINMASSSQESTESKIKHNTVIGKLII